MKRSNPSDDIESLMDRLEDDPWDLPVTSAASRVGDDDEDDDYYDD